MKRMRDEKHARARGPADVLVGDVERLLDVDRGAQLREAHALRRLRRGHDHETVLEREREHHGALLAALEVLPGGVDYRRGRLGSLERCEETPLARAVAGALVELRRDDDRATL